VVCDCEQVYFDVVVCVDSGFDSDSDSDLCFLKLLRLNLSQRLDFYFCVDLDYCDSHVDFVHALDVVAFSPESVPPYFQLKKLQQLELLFLVQL
jgi:hypothetical protein